MKRRRLPLAVALKSLPDPVLVLDRQGRYLKILGGAERSLYDDPSFLAGKTLHDVLPTAVADHYLEVIHRALDTGIIQVVEYCLSGAHVDKSSRNGPVGVQWFQGRVAPLSCHGRVSDSVLWTVINITEKKEADRQRDRAMEQLERALVEIQTLRGVLPICSACKKIRDEEGGWHTLEKYISEHSDADFSHGICPDCLKELYPECCPDVKQGA